MEVEDAPLMKFDTIDTISSSFNASFLMTPKPSDFKMGLDTYDDNGGSDQVNATNAGQSLRRLDSIYGNNDNNYSSNDFLAANQTQEKDTESTTNNALKRERSGQDTGFVPVIKTPKIVDQVRTEENDPLMKEGQQFFSMLSIDENVRKLIFFLL